jgi:hypothetical protein
MGFRGKLVNKEKPSFAVMADRSDLKGFSLPRFAGFLHPPIRPGFNPLGKAKFGGGKAGRFATVAKLRTNENPCAVVIPANLRNVPTAFCVSGAEVTNPNS